MSGLRVRVVLLAVGTALAALPSCYWLRYHDLVLTHVSLMSRLAADAAEQLGSATRPLEPSDIERLRYPLDRARHFLDVSRGSRGDLRSFHELEAFTDGYERLVALLDRVRVGEPGPPDLAEVRRRAAALEARAEAVAAAVAEER